MRPLPLSRLPRAAWTLAVSFAGEWDKDGRDLVPPGWRPRIAAATVGLYALSLLVIPGAHQSKDGRVVAVLRRQERRANLLVGLRAAAIGSPLFVAIALGPSWVGPAVLALLALVIGPGWWGWKASKKYRPGAPKGALSEPHATWSLSSVGCRPEARGPYTLFQVRELVRQHAKPGDTVGVVAGSAETAKAYVAIGFARIADDDPRMILTCRV
ncbi:hypothetical protein L603_004600000210 [Cellulosimicrobium cellulans J34]|nr:hypothetical protein L603_004600000210 [Cellulosimicrobium cellulans J34]SMF46866.1 hypothetical protein SAMN02744115_03467 [Cellulosimicrobium cellulans J1]